MQIKNLVQQYIYWPEVENVYQKNVDFSQVNVADLNSLFKSEMQSDRANIAHTIIKFYALNEILAKLRQKENELLDEKALDLYKKYMQEVEVSSKKLFTYVFFISLMEARHCYSFREMKDESNRVRREDNNKVDAYRQEITEKYSNLKNLNSNRYHRLERALEKKYGAARYDDENPLRPQYRKESNLLEEQYYKLNNKIDSMVDETVTIYSKELRATRDERIKQATQDATAKMTKDFMNQEGRGEDISEDKFIKFLEVAKELTNIDGYNRGGVYDTIMPILQKEEFSDMTIEDMMKCVVNVFRFGRFSSSYGGEPWAKITEHGLNFVRGKMNAEVFLDQAFSLEHNNGNMFNKDIIFENAGYSNWYSYQVFPEAENKNDYFIHTISNCQFLLNAQHQGQLLSLLNLDYKNIYDNIGVNNFSNKIDESKKLGLFPKEIKNGIINNLDYYINENLNLITTIVKDFHKSNKDFKNNLTDFKVEVPNFDIGCIINGCKTDTKVKVKFIAEDNLFQNLTNYQLQKPSMMSNNEEIVNYSYSFEYLDTKAIPVDKLKKETLGNKAFGLAQMHEMDLPVPNALVFPTNNAGGYFKEKAKWLNDLRPELNKIKNYFTDSQGNPIACSVRSGSSISMPGMMDTILNVGIDDSNYDYFCKKMGKEVTNECVTKFMTLFSKSLFNEEVKFSGSFSKALFQFRDVLHRNNVPQDYDGLFPLNARQQYKWCLEAVFKSWNSERATVYRAHQGISHDIGTAAIVQQMVFGNLNDQSCTGVVFSRDCISGEKGVIGEFLPKAQGEDVVSGAVTPKNIKELKDFNPVVYDELIAICERLEKDTGDIQDIEFTVEDGKLYILQKRKAVCSSLAQTKLNQELFETGLISEDKMLQSINLDSLVVRDVLDTGSQKPEIKGLVGNPGVLRGIVIHSQEDMITYAEVYEQNKRDTNFGWIFYAPETSPDHAPVMLKTQGFITSNGGFTSHAAILSRSWDKPCIVGVGHEDNMLLKAGSVITMDANSGNIYKEVLPLKEGSKAEVANMVNLVLNYHKVNLEDLMKEDISNIHSAVLELNNKKSWMEDYASAVKVEANPVKHSKFLDIGHKIALMVLKAKEDSHKLIKETIADNNELKLQESPQLEIPIINTPAVRNRMYF